MFEDFSVWHYAQFGCYYISNSVGKYLHNDVTVHKAITNERGAMTGAWISKEEAQSFLEKVSPKPKKRKYTYDEIIEEEGVFQKYGGGEEGFIFISNTMHLFQFPDGSISIMDSSWREDTFEKMADKFTIKLEYEASPQ